MLKKLSDRLETFLASLLGDVPIDIQKYLKRGTLGLFGIQVISILLTFFSSIILARFMGAENFGLYAYTLSWIMVLGNMGSLGADDLIMKELPEYQVKGEKPYIRGLILFTLGLVMLLSIVFASAYWFWGTISQSEDFQQTRSLFRIILWVVPFFALTLWAQGMLRGNHFIISGQLAEKIIRPGVIVVGALLVYYLNNQTNAPEVYTQIAAIAMLLSGITALGLFFLKFRDYFKDFFNIKWAISKWRRHLFSFFLISIIGMINSRVDVILLGKLGAMEYAGIYNNAARLVEFSNFFMLIVNLILSPLYARFFTEKKEKQLQKLLTLGTRVVFFLSLPILFLFLIWGNWILSIFGPEFSAGYTALLILSGGQLFYLFMGPAAYALMMYGYSREAGFILVIGFIVTFTLEFILIPILGMEGAAIGRAVGVIVMHALNGYLLFGKLRLRAGILPGIWQ